VSLTLLGKPGCSLCDKMDDVVQRVVGTRLPLQHADVRSDPDWLQRYRYEIPVLLWEGQEIARHRITEEELRERLASLGVPV